MPYFRQAVLSLALVGIAAAAWLFYDNPEMAGLGRDGSGANALRAGNSGNRIPGLIGQGGAVNVVVALVETDEAGETLVALGTAKAARSVMLYPQVTGTVDEVLFAPGEAVAADQPLVRLDDGEQQVEVDRARVALDQARATLERSRALAESRTISDVALSDAETTLELAEIEVRSAEIALDRRTLSAPFAGVMGLTDISIGDLVTTTTAITALDDLSTVHVRFEVPERWAGRIAQGQAITATAQGLPGSEFAGRITGVDNRVDETTRTLRLEAELANEGFALKSGMAIRVAMRFESDEHLVVPSLSVQWDRDGSFVWKVVDGAARRADVTILRRQSGIVTVQGELAAGETVVVEGIQRLREGAMVTQVNETPALVDEESPVGSGAPEVSGAASAAGTRS
jgi:RND family efflux transporter MFP subunit